MDIIDATATNAARIGWQDILVISAYFVLVLGIGIWASFRAKTDSVQGYFLAGRTMPWVLIGASTFATNVGAPMFIGLAGSAAASGIAVVMFEWHAMFMLLLLGWLFLPVYISCGCFTMPQYLKMRYGGQRIRIWIAIVNTFLTIISMIAGQIYAGALFITHIFQWNLYASVIFVLVITALYTIIGGLTAVIWTDAIQMVIIITGSLVLSVLSLKEIGGYPALKKLYMSAAANYTIQNVSAFDNISCGYPREDAFHIFRSVSADYPWPGMIGGLTILALSDWCMNQVCVQRSLSAKNIIHAKAGVLLAAYLKILPFILFIIPGMISRVLFPDEIACADPEKCREVCGNPKGCSNIAYPLLVLRILPTGLRGLMLAALLAALMSSLTSIFNSSSTLFTMDIWRRIRPKAKEAELMIVGRIWTLVLAIVGVLWLPILVQVQGSEFWNYSQSVGSYLLPPIVVVYLLGIFWKRTTEKGALVGLIVGFIVGVIRMGLAWSISTPACGSGETNRQFSVVKNVHYLHFAIILAVVTAVVVIAVSLLTVPRKPNQLHRVTWWTRYDKEQPDLSDNSDIEQDNEEVEDEDITVIGDAKYENKNSKMKVVSEEHHQECNQKSKANQMKHYLCKYVCGVSSFERNREVPTREKREELYKKMTSITESVKSKIFLNINMVICAGVAIFLHAFWA